MSVASFDFTDRARAVVQIGFGDTRIPVGAARWDTSRWDTAGSTWVGTTPNWQDVTCDTVAYRCAYGRERSTDRFIVGFAQVIVDNSSGWADALQPPPGEAWVRPGASIRVGIQHESFGTRWLFRGVIDDATPTYRPDVEDAVELVCVDALGDVNRAKLPTLAVPVGAGETVTARIARILDAAKWAAGARDLQPTADTLIATDLSGQVADLLGQAADSGGGSVFGDDQFRIAFRPRDWQTFMPGTPPDGTIGNVDPGDVCPVEWVRPYARADITTRVIVGRDVDTAQVIDDLPAQRMYGIEPFERTDLLTESDARIGFLGNRYLRTRGAGTVPRVRSVSLDASTADNALDLMTTVDVYKPSRYRCRLVYPRGVVFDAEHFATGVEHEVTRSAWTLKLNLDLAAPFAAIGGRWDQATWDHALWSAGAVARARELTGATP